MEDASRQYWYSLTSKQKHVIHDYITDASNVVNHYLLNSKENELSEYRLSFKIIPGLLYAQTVEELQRMIEEGSLHVTPSELKSLGRTYDELGSPRANWPGYIILKKYAPSFTLTQTNQMMKDFITTLMRILKNAPRLKEPLVVYRGFARNSPRSVKPGDYVINFFASTTLDPKVALRFMDDENEDSDLPAFCCLSVFSLPVGFPAFLIDEIVEDEKEIILNVSTFLEYRGTRKSLPTSIVDVFGTSLPSKNVYFFEVKMTGY
jgi:hypothetical protein